MKTLQTEISEVHLIYRTKVKASDRPQIKCSKDEYELKLSQIQNPVRLQLTYIEKQQ